MRTNKHAVEPPKCPEDCAFCSGEACELCGAGCWSNAKDCQHDVIERHTIKAANSPAQPVAAPDAPSSKLTNAEFEARGLARSRYHDKLFAASRSRPTNEQFDEGWEAARQFYTRSDIAARSELKLCAKCGFCQPHEDGELCYSCLHGPVAARSEGEVATLAKRIAQRAFNMKSNQDIVEAAALSVLSESPTSAGDEVERAFEELKALCPSESLSIKRQEFYGVGEYRSSGSPFSVSIQIGEHGFSREDTVEKAIAAVREWKRETKWRN